MLAVLLSLFEILVPQRAGPVAAFAAIAPIAYGILALALLPLAVLRRDVVLAAAVTGACLLASFLYAAPPAPPRVAAADPLTIMAWNLHGEDADSVGLEAALARWDPDIVVMPEAVPDAAEPFISQFGALHHPGAATPPGMLLASRLQILDSGVLDTPEGAWDRPRAIWLRLETGRRPLTVIGVHLSVPFPLTSLPCPYCPSSRDQQVAAVAAFAAERQAAGESVVVAGDLNLTEREVAYDDLAGLTDVARGGTWRPLPISWLPPVLRLDYVLTGSDITVDSTDVDCAVSSSDHCVLIARLAVP